MIPKTPITDADLAEMERLALAASQADWQIGHTDTKTHEEAITFLTETIAKRDSSDLWLVFFGGDRRYEGDQEYADESLTVAITGNGPTSEANAAYLAACKPATLLLLINELRRWRSTAGTERHA